MAPNAREHLFKRERASKKNFDRDIRAWESGQESPALILDLPSWASARRLDARYRREIVAALNWTPLTPENDR